MVVDLLLSKLENSKVRVVFRSIGKGWELGLDLNQLYCVMNNFYFIKRT